MPVTIGGSGPITGVTSINTSVSDTELGYLDGVTSALQTQINAKANDSSQGLYLITSQSFSAVSAVNINNCFSSTYDVYSVTLALTGASSTSASISLRLRASGSDASATNWASGGFYTQVGSNSTGGIVTNGSTAYTFGVTNLSSTYEPLASNLTFYWPALSSRWTYLINDQYSTQGNNNAYRYAIGAVYSVSAAYDGFSIFPGAGTITGTVRIYGMKN